MDGVLPFGAASELELVVAARVALPDSFSSRLAAVLRLAGTIENLLATDSGEAWLEDPDARRVVEAINAAAVLRARSVLERLCELDARAFSVLDEGYPANLRVVYDRPALITVQGELRDSDRRAVAIVGTRAASSEGIRRARRLARELAGQGVTIISGLALGIDAAAHTAALEAGGRSIAVVGTGIGRVYPREHVSLAAELRERGAIVSQFLPPDAAGAKWTFPARNKTMSGLALATIVVEAGETSGAKLQAQYAIAHGKRVILLRSLVEQQAWARELESHPGASLVESTDDVLDLVARELRPAPIVIQAEPATASASAGTAHARNG